MLNTTNGTEKNMFVFNIVCSTIGRDTLPRLIDSFKDQLSENDIFTVISDTNHNFVEKVLSDYNFKFKCKHIKYNGEGLQKHKYGHPLINENINSLDGDFIMFADDDDRYTENAFSIIKQYVIDKNKLYIFKHNWYGDINWKVKNFNRGNVGKCMGVIPNTHNLPLMEENILGDVIFYEEISKIFDSEFIDYIIYKIRDTE